MLNKLFKNNSKILDQKTNEILELASQKKMIEIELQNLQLELKNKTLSEKMRLEEEAHKQKLRLEEEKATFQRQKTQWEEEKQTLIKKHREEMEEFIKKSKAEFDLKLLEAVTLAKLDSEQKIKQLDLDLTRQLTEEKVKHIEELSSVKNDLNTKYYDKMTEAFADMQLNGDKNTKFVQEMALKIFDRVPTQSQRFELDFNANKSQTLES